MIAQGTTSSAWKATTIASVEKKLRLNQVEGVIKCSGRSIVVTDEETRTTLATAASQVDYVKTDRKKRPPEDRPAPATAATRAPGRRPPRPGPTAVVGSPD